VAEGRVEKRPKRRSIPEVRVSAEEIEAARQRYLARMPKSIDDEFT